MIPKECKRLAEVDFPIAEVSKQATREKSIRHGHPSTLHLWWARRPLASSRAMLLGLLLPDPCDSQCPQEFKDEAREILLGMDGRPQGWTELAESDEGLRQIFMRFIEDFANWNNAAEQAYLDTGRALVKAAHGEEAPLVVDPFAGGGSIPLEALRLGCETFASDLNPVACFILKVLLEEIPRQGPTLAEELRKVGDEIQQKAQQDLSDIYPNDPDGSVPVAYLWARTVNCEAPDCGAEIPLMRSMWLCNKSKRKWALRPVAESFPNALPCVSFEIYQPITSQEVHPGTVTNAKATCLCCGIVLSPERVRAQLSNQSGGGDVIFDKEGKRIGGARMTAVVLLKPDTRGRSYRLPTEADYTAVRKAQERIAELTKDWEDNGSLGYCPIPDEPTPTKDSHRAVGSQLPLYNITTFGGLFTARQQVGLVTLVSLVQKSQDTLRYLLSIAINRIADGSASVSSWLPSSEEVKHVFARQALPLVWDFGESNYIAGASRSWVSAINSIAKVVEETFWLQHSGQVEQADATDHPLPDEAASVWFTDPPYYDAVPYADLSDFFLVWLKRTLSSNFSLVSSLSDDSMLSPKTKEIVQCEKVRDATRMPKDKTFYENAISEAFAEGRRVLNSNGVGSIVFAHKTTEGWEALLSGVINGGWILTGSWPVATEMGTRVNARDTASLATSVHLVCRPRPEDAPVGDWADVLRELPNRVGDWMERLQGEGIRGADLVFACVGPALEIFSRCSRVETAEGREVKLPEYLEKVWEVVGRTALEQVLGTAGTQAQDGLRGGVLEEDSRLTALFLWTLQSTGDGDGENEEDVAKASAGGFSLPYDVVRRFAQPMGIDLDAWTGRIIEQKKGVVRLLPVAERSKALFGQEGASAAADWIETDPMAGLQQALFAEADAGGASASRARGRRLDPDAEIQTSNPTVLDRLHAAMLLQASGHTNALRALIAAEQDRGPDFLRLANALTALYPRGSQEKRLLDAMLLAVPR